MRRNKLDLISREGVAKIKVYYHQKGVRHEDILDLVPECRRIGWNNSAYISRLAQKEGWGRKVAFAPKVRGKRKLGQQAAEIVAAQAAPQPAPEAAALEPDGMIASLPVYVIDGKPLVRDIDLAVRLGMAQPLNIRQLIKEMEAELLRYGPIHARDELVARSQGGGRSGKVAFLNEAQSRFEKSFYTRGRELDAEA